MPLDQFTKQLRRSLRGQAMRDVVFSDGFGACVGISQERDPASYRWDGQKRGGDPRHPLVILQYTLAGWGCFQSGPRHATIQRVGPGQMFVALIPSAHRYWLPSESPIWQSAWVILRHPYVAERLTSWLADHDPVMDATPDSPLGMALAKVISEIGAGFVHHRLNDHLNFERLVIDLALTLTHHRQDAAAESAAARLCRVTDDAINAHPHRFIGVEELAAVVGWSRGHFSEMFRTTVGTTPARYILHRRLDAVRAALRNEDTALADLARRFGFTDAAHLRRAFRQHLHVTPGAFRRQAR
jgi:AraC-like DNA-binding protein